MPDKLKVYNTLSRSTEEFAPQDSECIKIYTCGPTVYSSPHIGNLAAYVYWDLLVRILEHKDYKVRRVLNLTDVGHLTSDGDEGEDKLEKGARISGESVWDVAERYIGEFKNAFRELNLTEPAVWARATDYIEQDMALVDILREKGYTYETSDGIYFDTSKFKQYADFAKLNLQGLQAGARVEFSAEKKNPADFAVWKFIQPGENHAMRWDYLGKPGYPGWHLECSTIIHQELGETIDIHTGGIDHIPVHHTNEIAQSEVAFEKRLANYWLHCNFLTSDGQKISKSLGNIYTLQDLKDRGYSALDFKMWVLQGSYQSERDFSLNNLGAAKARRLNWRNRIALCYQREMTGGSEAFGEVLRALDDNLNSAQAFSVIDGAGEVSLEFWQKIDEVFGLGLLDEAKDVGSEVKELLRQRAEARENRDFATSDALRDELLQYNIAVLDGKDGQIWQFLS